MAFSPTRRGGSGWMLGKVSSQKSGEVCTVSQAAWGGGGVTIPVRFQGEDRCGTEGRV